MGRLGFSDNKTSNLLECFKEVGERFGAFDWMFAECGQYNENWYQTHMHPEESIQAAIDAGAKIAIPYHWGGFALAICSRSQTIESNYLHTKNRSYENSEDRWYEKLA